MNRPAAAHAEPGNGSSTDRDDWVSAMRAGDFERAWAISDRVMARLYRSGPEKHTGPRHLQRIWRGEELGDRRVLVRCYHGLGDTIQFARFLPALRQRARQVTMWCQPELLTLIGSVEGVDRAIPLHDGTPEAEFEADIEIMEIPHAIRAGRDLIQASGPYLALPPRDFPKAVPAQQGISIGLVWEVGDWDKRRSVPALLLKRLNRAGVRLYSLQRGAASATAAKIGAVDISTPEIVDLGHRISELDVVLCVDTMVAHLAGALGRRAWIMLHADCEWRWPASGSNSYWYPTVRLFHQGVAGDWAGVVEDVCSALTDLAPAKHSLSYRELPPATVTSAAEPIGRPNPSSRRARVAGELERSPVGGDGGNPA